MGGVREVDDYRDSLVGDFHLDDKVDLVEAVGFRPITRTSCPPENQVVLVRYRAERPEVKFKSVSRLGSKVYQHRVYPALPIYHRAPYGESDRMFVGFVVLEPRADGAADAARYEYGLVAEAFDGWMPCPS